MSGGQERSVMVVIILRIGFAESQEQMHMGMRERENGGLYDYLLYIVY